MARLWTTEQAPVSCRGTGTCGTSTSYLLIPESVLIEWYSVRIIWKTGYRAGTGNFESSEYYTVIM